MKRILFITPYNPFIVPLGAASKSVKYRIENLSSTYDVHLLTFSDRIGQYTHLTEDLDVSVHFVANPLYQKQKQPQTRWTRLFKTMFGRVEALDHFHSLSRALIPAIQTLTAQHCFDLIHVDDIIIAPAMNYCPQNMKIIFFFHNLMTLQYKNIYRSRTDLARKVIAFMEYLQIRKFEKNLLRQMKSAVVLTKIESETAHILSPDTNIYEIPLEINLNEYTPAPDLIDHQRITFTGTMSYEPNHEGASYFIKKIFPLIRKDFPNAKFFVVGMNPPKYLQDLGDDRIIITGEVNDMQEYINQSAVIVVPLLSGGGMRYKILEAFALSKAVVSTSVGAEGIEYTDNESILIADEPQHFAHQVCELLNDAQRAVKLGTNARQLMTDKYDSRIVQKQWNSLYAEILDRSGGN
jgi:glycosyltransferase involved in cell wall biosynthesis